ncbi:MAG: hypothetical protein O7H41_15215 [Planctomycetota bacterium]|nr:hypothetical protein [Planctomycetota bacterium]
MHAFPYPPHGAIRVGANGEVLADLDPDIILAGTDAAALSEKTTETQRGRWCEPEFRTLCRRYAEKRFPWSLAIDRLESLARELGREERA